MKPRIKRGGGGGKNLRINSDFYLFLLDLFRFIGMHMTAGIDWDVFRFI